VTGAALLMFGLSGCATFSSRTEALRRAYDSVDYPAADSLADGLIADAAGVSVDMVRRTQGLGPAIDPRKKDTLVYLLDKGMIRLALDDPATAMRLFRVSRDTLDVNYRRDTSDLLKEVAAILTDDTVLTYSGADYEHLMVRAMLALSDLVVGGGDAYAYAAQIGAKQEEIIGSPLGEVTRNGAKEGYRPREQYRRIALGAYLQGIIREDALEMDEAARAYERAFAFAEGAPLYAEALERVTGKRPPEPGQGALHVFYFGGIGPYLGETRTHPTELAIRLAGIAAALASGQIALATQAPVPVPVVNVTDPTVPPLTVAADGRAGTTETVLDVNRIAMEQLDANMPWIIARAILRRSAKGALSVAAGKAVQYGTNSEGFGQLIGVLVGLITTATENADTRSWETLPATIQALRLGLPAGEQTVSIGGYERRIRIAPGRNSYVIVIQPSAVASPVILIDRYSRI
jgi:hypothetical protein